MLAEPLKNRYDLNFSILGIPVCINPFFWLIAIFLGWSGSIQLIELSIWVIAVLISILVHELGHAMAARRFGARNVRIVLHGMGGQMISGSRLNERQRIIELLCGPAAGFLLLVLIFLLSKLFSGVHHHSLIRFSTSQLIYINLVWTLLNLIPILPLDGGQIMRELINRKRPWDGADITVKISMVLSSIVVVGFVISAVISMFRGYPSNWYPAAIFAILAAMNYQMYKSKYSMGENASEASARNPWERDPDWWKS